MPVAANGKIILVPYAIYPFTIDQLFGLKTGGGSITMDIQINGVSIPGLSGLNITTTLQNPLAANLNAVGVGDEVAAVLSNNASATNLVFAMQATETTP